MAGIVDLSFASTNISRTISWKVSDIYTHSDHRAILMRIERHCRKSTQKRVNNGWNKDTLDEGVLRYLITEQQNADLLHGNTSDAKASLLSNLLTSVCDASMVKESKGGQRWKPAFRWNRARRTLHFNNLRDGMNTNPWGGAYKVVMSTIRDNEQKCIEG